MKDNFGFNLHYTYTDLPEPFYQLITHTNLIDNPSIVFLNEALVKTLGLDAKLLASDKGVRFLTGQILKQGMQPYAMAYAGHQYGQFTNLGDGRAMMLGEHKHNGLLMDIHIKGALATHYARGFDGKATLRSMLLEYVYSEALHALKVPTSRSLAVLKSPETINRIGFKQRGLLVRTMLSHLRVGNIEYASYFTKKEDAKALIDYAINRLDPDLKNDSNKIMQWYARIIRRQAKLVALWQSVGFVHGVINTDNTTLSGETIDFGPCAFIDDYNPKAVYSSIDYYGRYAFGRQPTMVSWNLAKLGEALLIFLGDNRDQAVKRIQAVLNTFENHYQSYFYTYMAQKIGFSFVNQEVKRLVDRLLLLMQKHTLDYTYTFFQLTYEVDKLKVEPTVLSDWIAQWENVLQDADQSNALMRHINPILIPRNHRIKHALDQAVDANDYTLLNEQLSALKNPFNIKNIPTNLIYPPKEKAPFVTYCGT